MDTIAKRNLSISEACFTLGISKSQLYKLISQGEIQPIKIGARTLFSNREVSRFADDLEDRLARHRHVKPTIRSVNHNQTK